MLKLLDISIILYDEIATFHLFFLRHLCADRIFCFFLIDVIGGLGPVTSPVGFIVQPVVGIVASGTILSACPDEVARILVLPLADLVSSYRPRRESYIRDGRQRNVWVIDHDDHYIWGLSAAILVDLAARMGECPAEHKPTVGIEETGN